MKIFPRFLVSMLRLLGLTQRSFGRCCWHNLARLIQFRGPVNLGCHRNFFAITLALWPPKPKELFTMALTFSERAVFGT